jgi:hypothetical protein
MLKSTALLSHSHPISSVLQGNDRGRCSGEWFVMWFRLFPPTPLTARSPSMMFRLHFLFKWADPIQMHLKISRRPQIPCLRKPSPCYAVPNMYIKTIPPRNSCYQHEVLAKKQVSEKVNACSLQTGMVAPQDLCKCHLNLSLSPKIFLFVCPSIVI